MLLRNDIFLIVGMLPSVLMAQSFIPDSSKTTSRFSLEFGVGYSAFPVGNYIEPEMKSNHISIADQKQYIRFEKIPTFCFNAGVRWEIPLNGSWGILTGMQYYHRNVELYRDMDTVIKYIDSPYDIRNIYNVSRFHYSYNNIEIPMIAYYKTKKIRLSTGCIFTPLSYTVSNYKYVIDPMPYNGLYENKWMTASKTVYDLKLLFHLFITADVEYRLAIRQYEISPLFGLQYAINDQSELVFRVGFTLPLVKRKSVNT